MTKVCKKCGEEKPIHRFPIGNTLKRSLVCNDCVIENMKRKHNKYIEMPWYEAWYLKG